MTSLYYRNLLESVKPFEKKDDDEDEKKSKSKNGDEDEKKSKKDDDEDDESVNEDHYGEPCADQGTVAKSYKEKKLAREAAHNVLATMIANRRRADYRSESTLDEGFVKDVVAKVKAGMQARGARRQELRAKAKAAKLTKAARSGLDRAGSMSKREKMRARSKHLAKKIPELRPGQASAGAQMGRALKAAGQARKSAANIRGSRVPGRPLPRV